MNIKKMFFYIYFICFFSKDVICSKEKFFEQNRKNYKKITNKKITNKKITNKKINYKIKVFFNFILKKSALTSKYLFSILFAVYFLKDFYISSKYFLESLFYINITFKNKIFLIIPQSIITENILRKNLNIKKSNTRKNAMEEYLSLCNIHTPTLQSIFWF
jgi:hypothetical protein